MNVNLISFYNRQDEYPTKYSLGTLRVASYIGGNEKIQVKIFPINLDDRENLEQEINKLLENDPDIVGIPDYIWTEKQAQQVSEIIHNKAPNVLKVVGGPSTNHIDFSKWQSDEIFMLGEGESSWDAICKKKLEEPSFSSKDLDDLEVNNVFSSSCDRQTRKVIYTNEEIPMKKPLYSDKIEAMKAKQEKEEFAWFETSRGCLYSCGYCGHKTRNNLGKIDLEIIRQEIENMKQRGIKRTFVVDPNLGGTRKEGKEVLKLFEEILPEAKIIGYLRPELLDDEYIELLGRANLEEMRFGIQTLNPQVPSWIRSNSIEKVKTELAKLQKNDINWRAELIVGLPGDNLKGVIDTTEYVIEKFQPTSVYGYHLTAIPGTKLYDLVDSKEDKWLHVNEHNMATESYSYSKEEFKKMAEYLVGVTSLYNYLKQKNPQRRIEYTRLVKFIRSHVTSEALEKFEKFDLNYAQQFWSQQFEREISDEEIDNRSSCGVGR